MSVQQRDTDCSRREQIANQLAANEQKIVDELNAAQGDPVDIGGYYRPDDGLASAAMRPSATFNSVLAQLD